MKAMLLAQGVNVTLGANNFDVVADRASVPETTNGWEEV
jgi:hypothetical protein